MTYKHLTFIQHNNQGIKNREREGAHDAARITSESQEYIAIQRFKMFFPGLIFATLSFIGVHPIHTYSNTLRILEIKNIIFYR